MDIKINKNKCLCCGGCVSVCPVMALELTAKHVVWDKDKCTRCKSCVGFCPVGAITLE